MRCLMGWPVGRRSAHAIPVPMPCRDDAAQTIQAFSARLRQQIDLDTLTIELLGVVEQTMQPTRVSLWLQPSVSASPDQSGPGASRAGQARAVLLILTGFLDQAVEYLASWNGITAEELLDDWQASAVRKTWGLDPRASKE